MEPGTKANQLPVKGRLVYPFLFLPSPSAIEPGPALESGSFESPLSEAGRLHGF